MAKKSEPVSVRDALYALPSPAAFNVKELAAGPIADWSKLDDVLEKDPDPEANFPSILRKQAKARGALGRKAEVADMANLMIAHSSESVDECIAALSQCLASKFRDVLGPALVVSADLMADTEDPGLIEKAEQYREVALGIGEPSVVIDRAEARLAEGDAVGAYEDVETTGDIVAGNPIYGPRTILRGLLVQAHRFADSQPEPVRSWFTEALGSLPLEDVIAVQEGSGALAGFFNVEGGEAAVAPRLYGGCQACLFTSEPEAACPSCARGVDGFVTVVSGDGVYPVVSWESDGGTSMMALLSDDDLPTVLYASAPLILGRFLDAKELFFSDGSMSYDSDYVALGTALDRAADYLAVAWLGWNDMHQDIRPIALGAVCGSLATALEQSLPPLLPEERRQLIASLWARPDYMVTAHTFPMGTETAEANLRVAAERGADDAASWLVLLAERFDSTDAVEEMDTASFALTDEFSDELELRGIRTLSLEWLTPTGDPDVDDLRAAITSASDPATSPEDIEELARHRSRWVRRAIASRVSLEPATMMMLAEDADDYTRTLIASRHDTPPDLLAMLAADPASDVRLAAGAERSANSSPTPAPAPVETGATPQ